MLITEVYKKLIKIQTHDNITLEYQCWCTFMGKLFNIITFVEHVAGSHLFNLACFRFQV